MVKWFYMKKWTSGEKRKSTDRYQRDFDNLSRVMRNPPQTWSQYDSDPQKHRRIIEMEIGEMNSAKERGDHHGYTENLIHVAAACLYAHHAMTCKESD